MHDDSEEDGDLEEDEEDDLKSRLNSGFASGAPPPMQRECCPACGRDFDNEKELFRHLVRRGTALLARDAPESAVTHLILRVQRWVSLRESSPGLPLVASNDSLDGAQGLEAQVDAFVLRCRKVRRRCRLLGRPGRAPAALADAAAAAAASAGPDILDVALDDPEHVDAGETLLLQHGRLVAVAVVEAAGWQQHLQQQHSQQQHSEQQQRAGKNSGK